MVDGGFLPRGLLGWFWGQGTGFFENSVKGSARDKHALTTTLKGRYAGHQFPSE